MSGAKSWIGPAIGIVFVVLFVVFVDGSLNRIELKQMAQQKIQQDSAADMPEKIGEMISVRVRVPDQIIQKIGDVLHRTVVRRGSVEREKMPERFRNEQGTLDERIVANEPGVIPNELPLQRGETGSHADDEKEETSYPSLLAVMERAPDGALRNRRKICFAHIGW